MKLTIFLAAVVLVIYLLPSAVESWSRSMSSSESKHSSGKSSKHSSTKSSKHSSTKSSKHSSSSGKKYYGKDSSSKDSSGKKYYGKGSSSSGKDKYGPRRLKCNGYDFGKEEDAERDTYRNVVDRTRFDRLDWSNFRVARCIAYKWRQHEKETKCTGPPKIPSDDKCDEDKTNMRCHVCYGAKNMTDCLDNGFEEECARGQNACIFQTHEVDGVELLWRRCGNMCECGPEDYVHYFGPEPDFYQFQFKCNEALSPIIKY